MNIGDTLIDSTGLKWVIFYLDEKYVYVTDLETQQMGNAFDLTESFTIEAKPANLEYLFIKRREMNLKGVKSS